MAHLVNLIGLKFGRLTVLSRSYKEDKHKRVHWKCLCNCGKEVVVDSSSLRSGNTKSCGCLQKEKVSRIKFLDISGKTFGRLTAIKYSGNKKWLCKCSCGKEKIVSGESLRTGRTKSCGCLHKDKMNKKTLPNSKSSFNKLMGMYKNKSKKRGYKFFLSESEFLNLTKGNCFYCGRGPFQESKCKKNSEPYIYNGIDRVNSSGDYELKNCVSCCSDCNYAKRECLVRNLKYGLKECILILQKWALENFGSLDEVDSEKGRFTDV